MELSVKLPRFTTEGRQKASMGCVVSLWGLFWVCTTSMIHVLSCLVLWGYVTACGFVWLVILIGGRRRTYQCPDGTFNK